jgi:L-threonylcarbamoyladenylate synthase
MEIIHNPSQYEIHRAAKALKDGYLVAFPTETVYGLGADASNEKAVGRIYSVKGRPTNHPLIVHISSINQLDTWAREIPDYARKLAQEFWPGPMTLILKNGDLPRSFVTGGQDSIGLRVPDNTAALALISSFEQLGGKGIAAPSANRFGAVSPTSTQAVVDELSKFLGKMDLILGDGDCEVGVESSIIDCTKEYPIVIRPGSITIEMIENLLGPNLKLDNKISEIRTSGQKGSHYSPRAKVVISNHADPGDGFIALANTPTPKGAIRLASPNSNEEYAKVIYKALRLGDQQGLRKIVVLQPNGDGLAVAIRDRLVKAASVMEPSDRS